MNGFDATKHFLQRLRPIGLAKKRRRKSANAHPGEVLESRALLSSVNITGIAYHDDVINDGLYTPSEEYTVGSVLVLAADGTVNGAPLWVTGRYQVTVPTDSDYALFFRISSDIYIEEVTVVDQDVVVDFDTTTAQVVVSSDSATETVTVVGSSLSDVITIDASAKFVTFNRMRTTFDSFSNPTFNVDGGSGQDSLNAHLTTGIENVSAGPDLATNLTVSGATNITANAEIIRVYSNGGADTINLHDQAASDDTFIAEPGLAYMLHDGSMASLFHTYAYDFPTVVGHASGSAGEYSAGSGDIAQLYDSAGNDLATAWPSDATLTDDLDPASRTYLSSAKNFDYVNFWATAGGTDTATFHSSPNANDLYVSRVTAGNQFQTYLRGNDYFNVANRFERTTAFSSGGNDTAQFYDTFGDDVFVAAGQNDAYMYVNDQIFSYAKGFTDTLAFSHRGGTDTAHFYDSEFDDEFTASTGSSTLQVAGTVVYRQVGFGLVLAFGRLVNAGDDMLNIQDAIDYMFVNGGGWETINE